ncbi:MAG: PqiC family protein [Thermodesulfovibrionales bacterium]
MTTVLYRVIATFLLGAALIVAGCASSSPPAKFYTLSPSGPAEPVKTIAPVEIQSIVLVGPVRIPDYLDRPQIATRSEKNAIELSEFNRWAGSLHEDIVRVLSENLSADLAVNNMRAIKWSSSHGAPTKCNVPIDIIRFEGTPGGSVRLTAVWSVTSDGGKTVFTTAGTDITEPVEGEDYSAVVASMSRTLDKLSREIAETIKAVPQ